MDIQWMDVIKTIFTIVPLSLVISLISKHGKFSATITKPTTFYNSFKEYDCLTRTFYYAIGLFSCLFGLFAAYCMFWFLNKNQTTGYLISAVSFMSFFIVGGFMFNKPDEYKTFTTFILDDQKYFIIGNRENDKFYLCKTAIQLSNTNFPKEFEQIKKDKINMFYQERVSLKSLRKYINKKKKSTSYVSKELIKYQKLLKKGIITQAEFDKKKEELLNL